jgi:hypothetical protein
MINARRSKQSWQVGAVVKVGFLSLRVVGVKAVYDGMPDIYTLASLDGLRAYEFIPHHGLTRID